MAKIALIPAPTFTAKVDIPIPGADAPASVSFTFRHRDRAGVDQYMADIKALDGDELSNDVAIVMKVATGWELDDPFTEDSVRLLVSNYQGAAYVIANAYMRELMKARLKN